MPERAHRGRPGHAGDRQDVLTQLPGPAGRPGNISDVLANVSENLRLLRSMCQVQRYHKLLASVLSRIDEQIVVHVKRAEAPY